MKNNSENNCKQMINTNEQLLTIAQVAEILNITTTTIRNWERSGKIKSTRTMGNHRRYRLCDVMKMMKGNQMQETTEEYVEIKSNGEIRLNGLTIQTNKGETQLFVDGIFIDLKNLQKLIAIKEKN